MPDFFKYLFNNRFQQNELEVTFNCQINQNFQRQKMNANIYDLLFTEQISVGSVSIVINLNMKLVRKKKNKMAR